MGAFFLYKKTAVIDLGSVKQLFAKKGFDEPYHFDLGSSYLLLYKKQLLAESNFLEHDGCFLFVIGTIIYKGKNYTRTKELLFDDFYHNKIEKHKLQGNYCAIFYDGHTITLMNDSMNVQHLFTDEANQFITSSFLAAVYAVKGKLTLNRMACYEKLTTGYIVGEDTLFNQVYHITKEKQASFKDWRFITWEPVETPSRFDNDGLKNSAARQVEAITGYMEGIKELAEQYRPEIGLSGGYDSRLLYAAALKAWPFNLSVHTHATEGITIHQIEKEIAKSMADAKGSPFRMVPTKNMNAYSEAEIEDILKDGLYFFDGRCAYNMGAFSPVYTRKYKKETIGDCRLSLNGLGGEMYRNYYMVCRPIINIKAWMKAHVYCACIDDVFVRHGDFEKMHQNICRKMEKELGFPWRKWVSNFLMRRYYSELRMPESDALNCNAHNQLAFYLTPFIERTLVEKAYKGYKYIGISGEYQTEMLRQMDESLAQFQSHYGFSFDRREPLKYKVYMLVRGLLPDFVWNIRVRLITRREGLKNRNYRYFNEVVNRCEYFKKATQFTEALFPEINFNVLRSDYAMMPNSSYISVLLYELRDKLEA